MIAQTVNSSFSSELYLKCLILIETNTTPRLHDLEKLFDQLKGTSNNHAFLIFPLRNPLIYNSTISEKWY